MRGFGTKTIKQLFNDVNINSQFGENHIEDGVDWLCECPIHFGVTRLKEEDDLTILNAAYDYEAQNRDNRFFLKTTLSKIKKLEKAQGEAA